MKGGKHGNYVDNDSSGSTENRKGDYMSSSSRSTEALWQAFFANPVDWWDNRKDKVTCPLSFILVISFRISDALSFIINCCVNICSFLQTTYTF
jgi:hypothetical protein